MEDHIDFISDRLPYEKWRPLYRKLMGKGAKNGIDLILASNRDDPSEQIHCALSGWKMSHGQAATVERLAAALECLGLRELAEELRLFGIGDEEGAPVNEPPETSANTLTVYMESHL